MKKRKKLKEMMNEDQSKIINQELTAQELRWLGYMEPERTTWTLISDGWQLQNPASDHPDFCGAWLKKGDHELLVYPIDHPQALGLRLDLIDAVAAIEKRSRAEICHYLSDCKRPWVQSPQLGISIILYQGIQISGFRFVAQKKFESALRDAERIMGLGDTIYVPYYARDRNRMDSGNPERLEPPEPDDSSALWSNFIMTAQHPIIEFWVPGRGRSWSSLNDLQQQKNATHAQLQWVSQHSF